jgi:hypothetical protein
MLMKKLIGILVAALIVAIFTLSAMLHVEREEQKVLINNNKALIQQVTAYKAKDGRTVTSAIVLQSAVNNLPDQQQKVVSNMKLRPLKVKGIGSIETRIDTTVEAVAIVSNVATSTGQQRRDTCYNFRINREFVASVCVHNDTALFHPTISDSLFLAFADERVFVSKRRAFFLSRWLQKRQTVVTANVMHSNQAIKTINQSFTYIIK